ncbi:hypothetical protein SEA_CLOWN_62 [Gordonia phage Clown]|uniref:Uncharacterized protein n=1 Tax=Gordonia phage Clown TaxID=2759393 RepID=A0A7L7SIV7_9CAUD|nr:hypothetical protein KNV25_gp62 [Gordonia phage Clown]QOC56060.1 hypothetical protein SEA_CLOWN_62 [Gordonia phage Clown]
MPRLFYDAYQLSQLDDDEREAYEEYRETQAEARAAEYTPVDNFDPTPSIHW